MTWDIVKIAALVLAVTQVIKGWWIFAKMDARLVSVIVTVVVVGGILGYSIAPAVIQKALEMIVAVIAANGGFKLLEKLEPSKTMPYGP